MEAQSPSIRVLKLSGDCASPDAKSRWGGGGGAAD